jgi:hypothetical protein
MIEFLKRLFKGKKKRGDSVNPRFIFSEDKMFKSIKVKVVTYNLIKDYAKRHNRSMATVVYIAMNHLSLLEKNYAKDTNKSN